MISAFQSREFEFGFEMTPERIEKVNRKRANEHYVDVDAAADVRDNTKKEPLIESTFVAKLEYGANKEGYWTGNHMTLQVKDCMDYLNKIIEDGFNFCLQFDHSSGHAKNQVFSLDSSRILKGFGGILQRLTEIKKADGYIGPFYSVNNSAVVKVKAGKVRILNWEG